jgi:hypothetical protein
MPLKIGAKIWLSEEKKQRKYANKLRAETH